MAPALDRLPMRSPFQNRRLAQLLQEPELKPLQEPCQRGSKSREKRSPNRSTKVCILQLIAATLSLHINILPNIPPPQVHHNVPNNHCRHFHRSFRQCNLPTSLPTVLSQPSLQHNTYNICSPRLSSRTPVSHSSNKS